METTELIRALREQAEIVEYPEMEQVMREAADRLEAQEPRVLTLEELLALPKDTPVFIEEDNGDCGWNVICMNDEDYDVCFCGFQAGPVFYPSKSYGICWRCWTSRPTDEQRKATPWEPPKEEA